MYCRPSHDFEGYQASIDHILSDSHEPVETLVTTAQDYHIRFLREHVGSLSANKQILRLAEVSYSFGHVSDAVSSIPLKPRQSERSQLISCAKIDYCRPLHLCKAEFDQQWHKLESATTVSAHGLAGLPGPGTIHRQRHYTQMLKYRDALIRFIFQFDNLIDVAIAKLDAEQVCLPFPANRSASGTEQLSRSDENEHKRGSNICRSGIDN